MNLSRWPLSRWLVKQCLLSRWHFSVALLTVSAAVSVRSEARTDPSMVTIFSASILLGSDMSEVIHAAETCSREADNPRTDACAPERFTQELSGENPVDVRSFFLDRAEVSVGEYERCVRVGRCDAIMDPRRIEAFLDRAVPAVFVRQTDARRYCEFRDARLPTEAEFELAMRGERRRRYPWGGDYHHGLANAGRSGARVTEPRDGYEMLAKTHDFFDGRTPEGVFQLSGNAAEWTSTPYFPHRQADKGASSSSFVVKGGSFMVAPVHLRGAARRSLSGGARAPDVGFRCARDLLPTSSAQE